MSKVNKKVRGKSTKPAMVYRAIRLPPEVLEFYNEYPNPSRMMREVLEKYMKEIENGSDT